MLNLSVARSALIGNCSTHIEKIGHIIVTKAKFKNKTTHNTIFTLVFLSSRVQQLRPGHPSCQRIQMHPQEDQLATAQQNKI